MRRLGVWLAVFVAILPALSAQSVQPRASTSGQPNLLAQARIVPLAETKWTDAERDIVSRYGQNGHANNELATLLNHPDLAASVMAVAKYFSEESTLSPRHREILILRTAWLARSAYLWAHRAAVTTLSGADLFRIRGGSSSAGLDPFEATLLNAADSSYANSSMSNAAWKALSARFDQHQMMDATFTVPAFTMMAMLDDSLGIQLEAGVESTLPSSASGSLQPVVPPREAPLGVARIPPLEPADWTPAIRKMLDPTGSGRNVIAVYRTFARHPDLYGPRQLLSEHIRLQNTLPAHERELLILRMGWIGRSEYEWQQHARTGRAAGLDTDNVAIGPSAAGWSDSDRLLLQAADEIYRDDVVSNATWTALAQHFTTKQMMDALVTAGGYRMVATVLNAFGVQLEPGGDRFPQR